MKLVQKILVTVSYMISNTNFNIVLEFISGDLLNLVMQTSTEFQAKRIAVVTSAHFRQDFSGNHYSRKFHTSNDVTAKQKYIFIIIIHLKKTIQVEKSYYLSAKMVHIQTEACKAFIYN